MENSNRLQIFIYGSLSSGFVHFNRIEKFICSMIPAKIRASAHRLKVGFPVLLQQGDDFISGHVATFESSESLIHLLDGFFGYNGDTPEKSLHLRNQTLAILESGDESTVWTYFFNPSKLPIDAKPIEGGDWLESLKRHPSFCERLSERQRNYILCLGSSSGREIVPIDMTLYRELISLELIVDKGRRLALSKFGSEVYRYLA